MSQRPYLLFKLDGRQYGIAAPAVQELFLLPALMPIAEAVAELVGILNLRGQIVPVIDLNQRLGQSRKPYTVGHSVIIVAVDGAIVGLIVDAVQTVEFIAATDVAPTLDHHLVPPAERAVTAGLAPHHSQMITLLNEGALVGSTAIAAATPPSPADISLSDGFLAGFSEADQQILKARASSLMTETASESLVGQMPLAVVELQNEYFALSLDLIQEFTEIAKITPIPCCPPHIVGNMNLRGEILTLVDIRPFLQLPSAVATRPEHAVVVRVGAIVVGIVVDAVWDVVYVSPEAIAGVPTAIHTADNEYVRSVTAYDHTMMSVLDIAKLLTQGALEVSEAA